MKLSILTNAIEDKINTGAQIRRYHLIFAVFSLCLPAIASKDQTQFIFINGGYSNTSNYSIHEKDLTAFRDNLFEASRMKLFNAGGPSSPVLEILNDGSFERDNRGPQFNSCVG